MARTFPRLVEPAPTCEHLLRQAIAGRDEALATVAEFDRIIAEQGREYAVKRGEFMRPTLERLRRDLGV